MADENRKKQKKTRKIKTKKKLRKISDDDTKMEGCKAQLREAAEPECHREEDDEDVRVTEITRDSNAFVIKNERTVQKRNGD